MAKMKQIGMVTQMYYVYIMTNHANKVLYTGVTSELESRCMEHRNKKYPDSFTAKYNVNKLVYYEAFNDIRNAIAREKQIKAGSRKNKIKLIEQFNPRWIDLFENKIGIDGL